MTFSSQMEEEVRLWAQRGQGQLQKGRTLKALPPQSKDELENKISPSAQYKRKFVFQPGLWLKPNEKKVTFQSMEPGASCIILAWGSSLEYPLDSGTPKPIQ